MLPPSITNDFDNFLTATGLCRMNATSMDPAASGKYAVQLEDDVVEFHNAEMAPPMGLVGINYARYMHFISGGTSGKLILSHFSSVIHNESQAHKYAIAFVSGRNAPPNGGGHFYLAQYGIRIALAPNTLFVWQPAQYHGTSLFEQLPGDTAILQSGLSIVTSNRLPGLWKRHQEKAVSQEQIGEQLIDSDSEAGE